MRNLFLFLALMAISFTGFAQTQWQVDPYHSSLNFQVQHLGISMINGKFTDFEGTMNTQSNSLANASFNFTVQIASLNTNVDKRDEHLKSSDFFDAEKYPTMTFKSTKVTKGKKKDQYKLTGMLTIKDATKEVTFDLVYGGTASTDTEDKMGMKAKTSINRFDFNIDYDPTAAGIAKEIDIVAHLQFAKQ
ncbi:YceI family protein [Arenibacter amylolyticus]|uniref:YceI family protein n=1 Tax=Arenibacter amylolyticus TaxID=1406873 RepID=UPI000A384E28|nr:YceI family protein [Arenibacter amylolyticus]